MIPDRVRIALMGMTAGEDDGQMSPAAIGLIKALSLTYAMSPIDLTEYDRFFNSPDGFFHLIEPCQLIGCALALSECQPKSIKCESAADFVRVLIDLNGPHIHPNKQEYDSTPIHMDNSCHSRRLYPIGPADGLLPGELPR